MKKILYTLFIASLLSVACTEEVLVSRNHDIDAEVATDDQTIMELTTLYCNVNDSNTVDLEQLSLYLKTKDADVVTFVAPATMNGSSFQSWLDGYAADNGYVVLSQTNNDGRLTMAAIVRNTYSDVLAQHIIYQGSSSNPNALHNAVLLFSVKDLYFIVTEMNEARNSIPADWEEQVKSMKKDSNTLKYDPDNLAERHGEVEYLLDQTLDNSKYSHVKYWMLNVDMNAPSNIDMKYGKVFKLVDCYDNVNAEAFIKKHYEYFIVEEDLAASDAYFKANDLLVYAGFVDCVAVQHSVYTPTSIQRSTLVDDTRNNFVYSSDGLWNAIESLNVDNSVEWGATHYPIMVTLKMEE